MSAPTVNNQAAGILNQVISILMSDGEKAAEVYLTALDPELLAIPIVQWIMDQGVQYLGSLLSVMSQKLITGIVIDIQTNGEKSVVIQAAVALQIALSSGDKSAIATATVAASDAYRAAINWDGSAQPIP